MTMVVAGLLLLVGWLTGINPLVVIGLVLVAVGVILAVADTSGPVGGRWY